MQHVFIAFGEDAMMAKMLGASNSACRKSRKYEGGTRTKVIVIGLPS
jgi:hypothetical protein